MLKVVVVLDNNIKQCYFPIHAVLRFVEMYYEQFVTGPDQAGT